MVGRALRLIAGAILVIGLASAVGIYATSTDEVAGYQPEATKQYLRTLELYGGKANVMATELREWFDSLWHGRRLAYTVGWASGLLAGAFWLAGAASDGPGAR